MITYLKGKRGSLPSLLVDSLCFWLLNKWPSPLSFQAIVLWRWWREVPQYTKMILKKLIFGQDLRMTNKKFHGEFFDFQNNYCKELECQVKWDEAVWDLEWKNQNFDIFSWERIFPPLGQVFDSFHIIKTKPKEDKDRQGKRY